MAGADSPRYLRKALSGRVTRYDGERIMHRDNLLHGRRLSTLQTLGMTLAWGLARYKAALW